MLAVLEDAVVVFVKSLSGGTVGQREARAARAWLESRDRSLPFAFECVCDALGFDSTYFRRGVLALRARPAKAAAWLARRHHGRLPRPRTQPVTVCEIAPRTSVADVAPAELACASPLRG